MATFSMNRQLHGGEINSDANLVRFHSLSSDIAKDKRGWLIDPVSLALQSGISVVRGGKTSEPGCCLQGVQGVVVRFT